MDRSKLKDVLLVAAMIGATAFAGVRVFNMKAENARMSAHEAACPYTAKFVSTSLTTSWAQGKVTYEFWYCDGKAVKARSIQPDPRTPGQVLILELTDKDCKDLIDKEKEVKP